MLELFHPGRSLAWDLAWQATAFLVLGGLASLLSAHRPARAHRMLLLAMIAGLVTPLLGQLVHQRGWGVLATAGVKAPPAPPVVAAAPDLAEEVAPRPEPGILLDLSGPPARFGVPSASAAEERQPAVRRPRLFERINATSLAVAGWAVLAGLAAGRFAVALVCGLVVVARARRVSDPAICAAAEAARERLGLAARPDVFAADRLRCPVIWCWARRPRLILPEAALRGDTAVDWVAVLSHELAHWGRRDHLAALVGEVVVCALPWHPLAWWAKGRLAQLAELACDDWVLASGQEAADYAETLLGLVPQGRSTLALAAVSSRGGLVGRVRRILADVRREPRPGRRWTAVAIVVTALAASITALAQSRPASEEKAEAAKAGNADDKDSPRGPEATVSGRVLKPDGTPAAGATVEWLAFGSRTKLSGVALPKQMQEEERRNLLRSVGRATTDADGRFRIVAQSAPAPEEPSMLAVHAPGAALMGKFLGNTSPEKELTLKLGPAATIEGRLLTPSGAPAAGVTVELARFHNAGNEEARFEGLGIDLHQPVSERPGFWPAPLKTDADGRFVLEGVVPRGMFAELQFRHPDFADDEVTVSTGPAITDALRAFDIRPVRPKFTHTLEPARPVEGTVTAKETGKPVVGATVELIPMRQHGGMSFFARTDERGHYRVAGHAADLLFVNVFPPLGSPLLDASRDGERWPEGVKHLKMDFALETGKLLRGTVVDAQTREPIARASVVYQPGRGNPKARGNHQFRNPVLTDSDGRFAIAGIPGPGYLLVEEGSGAYMRTELSGKETGIFGDTLYPHGFTKVDVAPDAEPRPVEITLRKGKTLEARAVGPDGRPLPMVEAWCPELTYRQLQNWRSPRPFPNGLFRLTGADPERTYRVFFLQKQLKLGTVAKLKLDPKDSGPIEVKLEPMATVKGVAVNKDGTPVKGAQIYVTVVLTEDDKPLQGNEFYERDKADFYSNLAGGFAFPSNPAEFSFSDLIPGLRYYITIARGGPNATRREVRPKAGEVIDLGKVTVEDQPQ